jgi:hypothetical protein
MAIGLVCTGSRLVLYRMYILFLLDVEDTVSMKLVYSMVGKSIEHVYITNEKNKMYQGNVLKFDSTSKKVHIKYKGCKSITSDNLSDIYDDFINGDFTLC